MPRQARKKRIKKTQASTFSRSIVFMALSIAAMMMVLFLLWQRASYPLPYFIQTPIPPTPTVDPAYSGVEDCRALPKFFDDMGLAPNPLVGTSFRSYVGFVVYDRNGSKQFIQHPSWKEAGNLGGFINDSQGNFYVIPVPFVSVELNPPEKQTILYRIDASTGEMAPVLTLPAAAPPSTANPFGLMGLGLDCETNSLYVTSVAGSSATRELGRIFRIDLATMQVADQLDGVDAIGVGVFKGVTGKRLYYGAARAPLVFSIALDENGDFVGEPREEFTLTTIPGVGNQRVRRINFLAPQEMSVRSVEFSFNLQASRDVPSDLITLDYDPASDDWIVREVIPYKPEP
jgi:hypothetical protein